MEILLPFLLIIGGLVTIFYIRPRTKNHVMEIQFMQTKTIRELKSMFAQMDENGVGNDYREYVELKGTVLSNNLVEAPFSGKKVVYCDAKLAQVTESKEQYRDSNGNWQTRINKSENTISSEQSSQDIGMLDDSTSEPVVLEINATGCKLDIPKTFDRFEAKGNLGNYQYFKSFSWSRFGAETLGFRMTEKTIGANQALYVIGEAFKVGNKIHIGKPQDAKKPFIVTTKSEEDLVNQSKQNEMFALVGGMIAIIIGIILLIKGIF